MTTIDHQQAATQEVAETLGRAYYPHLEWEEIDKPQRDDFQLVAFAALTAATPHLRAAWEQPIRKLHRPVHAVFSWADGPRYEDPCETCHGAPGVHECGCWADTPLEYVCAECHRLGSGSKGVYDYTWPCPTIALLEGGGEPFSAHDEKGHDQQKCCCLEKRWTGLCGHDQEGGGE